MRLKLRTKNLYSPPLPSGRTFHWGYKLRLGSHYCTSGRQFSEIKKDRNENFSPEIFSYLKSLHPLHAAPAAGPHEAEPLDPVVGGHGGVPDPVPTLGEAVQAADKQQDQAAPACQVFVSLQSGYLGGEWSECRLKVSCRHWCCLRINSWQSLLVIGWVLYLFKPKSVEMVIMQLCV